MKKLLIWGAGDQGTVTRDCALATSLYSRIDFLDFKEKGHREIPGCLIYEEKKERTDRILRSYDEVIVASGDNDFRQQKISVLDFMGIPVATLIHPTAVISPSARISRGCSIFANVVIHTNAAIGTGCIVNTAAVIEHDCSIGDFVNISPRACMAGHTTVGSKSFLGIGCTIIDQITVGQNVTIGAGAVVIRDIQDGMTAVGVPARGIFDM